MTERDEIPLSSSELVLGARISYDHRAYLREDYRHPVRVEGFGDRSYISGRQRRYLAAWARRVLFGGSSR